MATKHRRTTGLMTRGGLAQATAEAGAEAKKINRDGKN